MLNNAEKHVKDLEEHIQFGHKLVTQKESKLFEIQKKIGHTQDKPKVFAEFKTPELFKPKQNQVQKITSKVEEKHEEKVEKKAEIKTSDKKPETQNK